jgi:hypothetical protein
VHDVTRAVSGVALLLALAGCGGSSGSTATSAGETAGPVASTAADGKAAASVTGPSAGASTGTGGGGASTAPVPAASAGATTGAVGSSARPSAAPTPTHIILDAALSSACITPGGSMTLTVRHARPGMQVIFDTTYSDGKDGKVHGGIDDKGTRTTTDGGYTFTFTVDPLTPKGEASLQVGAVDQMGYGDRKLTFQVAPSCG